MKVYGWTMMARGRQLRCIMAAKSRAEVARAAGVSSHFLAEYGAITANDAELEAAHANPGVVLCRELDDRRASYVALRS